MLKPFFIALSVTDDIQRRLTSFSHLAFSKIYLATSSPSLPASVAIIISLTSFLFNAFSTILYCLYVFLMTSVFIYFGIIGNFSNPTLINSLYLSGVCNVTKCPKAHVTIYLSPSRHPFLFCFAPKFLAISRATDGFSHRTTLFIFFPHYFIILYT